MYFCCVSGVKRNFERNAEAVIVVLSSMRTVSAISRTASITFLESSKPVMPSWL